MQTDEIVQGGISSDDLNGLVYNALKLALSCRDDSTTAAGNIAKACASCGISTAEFLELANATFLDPEDLAAQLLEKGSLYAKARKGPTGYEGIKTPRHMLHRYRNPAGAAKRKKKHGRERGRKL